MKLVKIKFAAAFLAFSVGLLASAAPREGYYIEQSLARYFPLPPSARTLALEGSDIAIGKGTTSLFRNPSGLGWTKSAEVGLTGGVQNREGEEFLTEEDIEEGLKFGYVTAAYPLGIDNGFGSSDGALEIGYSRYQGTVNDSIRSSPDGHRRSIAYGYAPSEKVSFGYAFHFYDDQLSTDVSDLHSHARILHLIGVQKVIDDEMTFGALFRLGLGQSDTEDDLYSSDGLSKPREQGGVIALSRSFGRGTTFISFSYSHYVSKGNLTQVTPNFVLGSEEDGYSSAISVGEEFHVTPQFTLLIGVRGGYTHYEYSRPDLQVLGGTVRTVAGSIGAGYTFSDLWESGGALSINYGFEYVANSLKEYRHLLSLEISGL